jgi:hypothetical protein
MTRVWRATRMPMKVSAAIPTTPINTTAPTMMRMVLRALLGAVAGEVPGGRGPAEDGELPDAPAMGVPHLLQNFVPSVSWAPQELQNAIESLEKRMISA